MPIPARVRLRVATETDDSALAALYNRSNPNEPDLSAEQIAWARGRADPGRPSAEIVAERDGALVGEGFVRGIPGRRGLFLNLDVDPPLRRRGIGTAMFADLLGRIGSAEMVIWTGCSEAQADSIGFLSHRGFQERDRAFESELDLTAFDPTAYADLQGAALGHDLRLTTLAAEDNPELRRRAYELDMVLDADVPSVEPFERMTYEEWVTRTLDAPHSRPEMLVLAMEGDRPVAMSSISAYPDGTAYNQMTGVLREYRGRSLGLATKVEALRLAKAAGHAKVRTDNHVTNAPMLSINERLGYRRLPGIIEFARESV